MRAFHLIFGHGSSENPGGSLRMEVGGWIMFFAPAIGLLLQVTRGGEAGVNWLAPLVMILGIVVIRASKKMP